MNRINDEQLGQILVETSYLEEEIVDAMLVRARSRSVPLKTILLSEELISRSLIGQAIAEHFGVEFYDVAQNPPDEAQIRMIPQEIAREYNLILYSINNGVVTFVTDDPKNPKLIEVLSNLVTTNDALINTEKIDVAFALSEDIEALFSHYEVPLQEKLQEILKSPDVSIRDLIDLIFSSAYESVATDIHLEPTPLATVVRFRVDGVLHDMADISNDLYEKVVNRIKVLARLRIDEHLAIQDGSFTHEWNKKKYDLRVSFVPTLYGEKLALRILARYVGGLGLDQIGLSEIHQKMLISASKKPFGMIIVAGPTGAGKTTTLYSVLSKLITSTVNVMTVEDPVEYRIRGATQVQVNLATGITFASGLRSLVRQDPDIILVGEIRDSESADIAVNAALTGHLLLSTFHANDASTVLPRLVKMGIEPFLLSSTIELIIAQRLVRCLCKSCRMSVSVSHSEIEKEYGDAAKYFPKKEKITLYQAKGCKACNFMGYKGRIALFEMIQMSKELRELASEHPTSDDVRKMARKQGMMSMFEDGIEKVKSGITTISEVLRVAQITD